MTRPASVSVRCPHCNAVATEGERVTLGTLALVEWHCAECDARWRTVDRRAGKPDRRKTNRGDRRGGKKRKWSQSDLIARDPWNIAVRSRTPILVTGPGRVTREFLEYVEPWLIEPIVEISSRTAVDFPEPQTGGTLILRDVDLLNDAAQRQLLQWLDADANTTLLISTSPRPLTPLVKRGQFLATLYYRLSTFAIHVGSESE